MNCVHCDGYGFCRIYSDLDVDVVCPGIRDCDNYLEAEEDGELKQKPVHFDVETRKWFVRNPWAQTTVVQCEECGLAYKPSLGHKCRRKKDGK